jgi:TRAP-type transport system periplasmic protein
MLKRMLKAAIGALGLAAAPLAAEAADPIKLRVSHFAPTGAVPHVNFMVPWCERIKTQSQGRLECQIYPLMQIGGTAPQLYDQARDGIADIAWGVGTYTPGRFPLMEVFELPFMAPSAEVAARASWRFATGRAKQEWTDVHLITMTTPDGGAIFSRKPIRTIDDMKGNKVRVGGRYLVSMMNQIGASPVTMNAMQSPDALSKGVIDSTMIPWELAKALRLNELVKNVAEPAQVGNLPMFYTTPQFFAMNRKKYDSLPADLRKVIDDNGGEKVAGEIGRIWDQSAEPVRKAFRDRGNTIVEFQQPEMERWVKAAQPAHEEWIKFVGERGYDGKAVLEEARAVIKEISATVKR